MRKTSKIGRNQGRDSYWGNQLQKQVIVVLDLTRLCFVLLTATPITDGALGGENAPVQHDAHGR